ncbi:MFS transporter [Actinoallomurus sp. CA-142502]|uniref:MFS transporter n=1 Tax=Actinoallomurus sp. CA-142502 TaxID=3239885 RepID=UPI003D8F45D5
MLALLLGTQFMLAADFSIFNVALPAVGRGVGLALDTLQWVATAYALPAAGFTLLFGRVADLAGRRRMLLIGLGLLAAASVYGGTAHTPVALLSARVVQGLSTVAVVAYVVAVTSGLPDHEQGLATGLSAMAQQVGTTVGIPLLSTIATAPGGIHSAVGVNAAIIMAVALLVRLLGRVPAAG